jgi:DNA-binding GntR family transcriptional regulator
MDALIDALEVASAQGDMAQAAELDFEFHRLIGQAAGNPYLLEVQEMLHRLAMRFVYLGFDRSGNVADTIADHRRIVDALRRRDADAAEVALLEHCRNGRDRMRAAL